MIQVKYPGKLYLLGEYLVLEPGKSALVMAVERYLYVDVKSSDTYFVNSAHGNLVGEEVFNSKTMIHVVCAINTVEKYLGTKLNYFNMDIRSELDAQSGKKYGFGSSGVVMIGVMDALLKYHGVVLDKLTLFKLAVFAQFSMNEVSSGGDLACSIYGGMIRYTRYDLNSVRDDIACVNENWNLLNIEHVNRDFNIIVAWSMSSHKSANSIEQLQQYKQQDLTTYNKLMDEANEIVSLEDIAEAIECYRVWMLKLGHLANIEIETAVLSQFIEYCGNNGLKAKVSGAGGGDCAIIYSEGTISKALIEGIESLGLEVLEGVIKDAI